MEIRKAEKGDLDGVNELLYQVANVHASGRADIFKSAAKKYTDEELLSIMNAPDAPIFVAIDEEKGLVGYAFCIFQRTENNGLLQDKKTLYIDDICVTESVRGQGVGTALYRYVEGFAKEQGFDCITLNVWAFNENAYRFYEKQGMRPRCTLMEKIL